MFDSIDDWLIIGVIFAILFWGSSKIPQLAHSLGRAVGEFKKGKMESERELAQMSASPSGASAGTVVVHDAPNLR